MAKITTNAAAASPTLFILSLILISSSLVSPSSHHSQFLDVSSSLSQTRQVFSSLNLAQTEISNTHQLPHAANSSSSLSFPLHPRISLSSPTHNNYTLLTLSRLARDEIRVQSISFNINTLTKAAATKTTNTRTTFPSLLQTPVISGISQGSGEYFARIGLGSPASQFYTVVDTGSDVTWLQCSPCSDCYKQTDPLYNPSASSTYKTLSCASPQCQSLEVSACRTDSCLYQVSYGDGSFTVGNFATDTVSFASSGSVPSVAFGCGHHNEGLFSGAAGLLGLGGGPLSLPSQIRATSFSYCLVNRNSRSSSSLEFNSAQPADSVLAPLLKNSLVSTYHYVGLTGIVVGGKAVPIPASLFQIGGDGRGGVIIDSGTAVTRLRTEAYNALRDQFASMARDLPSAGGFSLFDTCYDFSAMSRVRVPTVAFQFAGGKTLALPPGNYLIPVDDGGKFCFAFAGTGGPLSIIGNVQQQGTRVSYNLGSKSIGFSPNKC